MGVMQDELLVQDAAWAQAYLERMTRVVLRDRNQPCVILWSLGNEASCGPNIDAMATWTRAVDPTSVLSPRSDAGLLGTSVRMVGRRGGREKGAKGGREG
eukprot:833725-Rhodomonas_salina.1